MVARSNMYGCYGSYSYRLWSLANVWSNCHFSLPKVDVQEATTGDACFIRCSHCHKSFPGYGALKDHVVAAHDGASASTSSPPPPGNQLALLDPAPTPGGAFACQQCSTTFAHRDQLEKHELMHSPNAQVSCKVCHKTFANVYRLQRHMISHDESAVLRKFKCPECEKAFKFKHHLKEHIRIHSGEKPFECTNCGKRFSHSGSYSSHMTSKKCLVMNLKVGRGRGGSLEKPQASSRNPGTPSKRSSLACPPSSISPLAPNLSSTSFPSLMSGGVLGPCPTPPSSNTANTTTTSSSNPFESYFQHLMHYQNNILTPPFPSCFPGANLEHFINRLRVSSLPPPPETTKEDQYHDEEKPTPKIIEIKDDPEEVEEQQEEQRPSTATPTSAPPTTPLPPPPTTQSPTQVKEQPPRADSPPQRSVSRDSSNSHSDPVKSLLETVGTSVTKERLEASMQKLSSVSPPPATVEASCKHCGRSFTSPIELHQHETYLCEIGNNHSNTHNHHHNNNHHNNHHRHHRQQHEDEQLDEQHNNANSETGSGEGLAAKLEEGMANLKSESYASEDGDSARDPITDDEAGSGNSSGRKVRVRSLIADEQLTILKSHYTGNPRPKKEELARIADQIGFPVRVVQVWFQNTRARDRREGRLVHIPYYLPSDYRVGVNNGCFPPISSSTTPTSTGLYASPNNNNNNNNNNKCLLPSAPTTPPPSDHLLLPLDLSTKKSTSSQCSSPIPSTTGHSDSEEGAMNLSHRSSRSPTPCHFRPYSSHLSHHHHHQLQQHHLPEGIDLPVVPPHHHVMPMIFRNTRDHSPAPASSPNGELKFQLPIVGSQLEHILNQPRTVLTPGRMNMFNTEHLMAAMNGHSHAGGHGHSRRPSNTHTMDYGETTDDADDSGGAGEDASRKKRRTSLALPPLPPLPPGTPLASLKLGEEAEGQYNCDQCDKAFSKQSSLARHKYEHSGQRPHKCDVCSKAFKHKHHLTEHKRLHSGEKPFQCSKCLKRFSHSGSYSQHMNHRYSYCKPYRE